MFWFWNYADWIQHAEILAIRAFNHFLIDECRLLLSGGGVSNLLRQREPGEITSLEYQPFTIKDDVEIHMYCSEAPCGDASMELVMEAQEDPTPWTETPPAVPVLSEPLPQPDRAAPEGEVLLLRGRSHFSYLGAVRLKPSRPDAPQTLSKSCTDKLAHSQVTSLLLSLTSLLVTPRNAYLTSLILPKSQCIPTATARAFGPSGRMSDTNTLLKQSQGIQEAGYAFRPFEVRTTDREFQYSRRSIPPPNKPVPSNLSAVYTPRFQETLIGGVLQGRKQFDPRGASLICRKSIWKAVMEVGALTAVPALIETLKGSTYMDVKESEVLIARKEAKKVVRERVLKGWVANKGDGHFSSGVVER